MRSEVILLKESEMTVNRIGDTLISTLKDMPKLRTENGEIKILTNTIFDGAPIFESFNQYLRGLKMSGVVCIMVDLEK
jgi:hypothetical protein